MVDRTERRQYLINKLKDPTQFLTKAESDELGPVISRELAPETGDSFMDEMLYRERLRELQAKIRKTISKAEAKLARTQSVDTAAQATIEPRE